MSHVADRPAPISRVLVANRGEIAVRIIRACRDLGLQSVLACSEPDRNSLAAEMADRTICIGGGPPSQSYLKVASVVSAAMSTGCQAVHPGYGFLAESPLLADACHDNGLKFVGPRTDSIKLLGDKIAARTTAKQAGVPVLPGSSVSVDDQTTAAQLAADLGYPVLVKAGAGGGGRGLRLVTEPDQLERQLAIASTTALAAFDDGAVYLEKYVPRARHIEIQVAGDGAGDARAFGERDCSIQRSYQKLVEESPSPTLPNSVRADMTRAALDLVKFVRYEGVGTVEFLYDAADQAFYFIEMNTRLQVEHPVTELVTGHDLVALQFQIAQHGTLGSVPDQPPRGHALELRINAEDPQRAFAPNAGTLTEWRPPTGPWVRVDTHCVQGYQVPPFYDSLLAKLVVAGSTRAQVLDRARRALDEFRVEGIATTIGFHRWLLDTPDFIRGDVHTSWLEENWPGMRVQ